MAITETIDDPESSIERSATQVPDDQSDQNANKEKGKQPGPLGAEVPKDSTKPKKKRHGSKNQHKMKFFVRWLVQDFPQLDKHKKDESPLEEVPLVVDIAGGKGELAARLCMCHRLRVAVVDPRPSDPAECFRTNVLPRLPRVWRDRISDSLNAEPGLLRKTFDDRVKVLQMHMTKDTLETNLELQQTLENAEVLVGVHADGATEAIVDAALKYNKPFIVVPCCVFPNFFQQRFIDVMDEETKEMKRTRVRSTEQFCQYLLEKDPRFKLVELPFVGRNVGIWWDGKDSLSGEPSE